jgi:hypothetical protein
MCCSDQLNPPRKADIPGKADVGLGVEFGSRSLSQKGIVRNNSLKTALPHIIRQVWPAFKGCETIMRYLFDGYSQ